MKKQLILIILIFGALKNISAQTETNKDTVKIDNKTIIFEKTEEVDVKKPQTVKVREEVKVQEEVKAVVPVEREEKKVVILKPLLVARHTEVGLNMTTLLSRLVPFGNAVPLGGPTSLWLKNYKENKAFRFGIGLQSSDDAEFKNGIIRIGREKRKQLKNPKWSFTRSIDFLWAFGSFDTPQFMNITNNSTTIGAALGYGIEYYINESVFISTESTVFLGLGGGGGTDNQLINFKILPPIAIFLNVNLNKK
jgi:hypothetical protein